MLYLVYHHHHHHLGSTLRFVCWHLVHTWAKMETIMYTTSHNRIICFIFCLWWCYCVLLCLVLLFFPFCVHTDKRSTSNIHIKRFSTIRTNELRSQFKFILINMHGNQLKRNWGKTLYNIIWMVHTSIQVDSKRIYCLLGVEKSQYVHANEAKARHMRIDFCTCLLALSLNIAIVFVFKKRKRKEFKRKIVKF